MAVKKKPAETVSRGPQIQRICALGIKIYLDELDGKGRTKNRIASNEVLVYEAELDQFPDLMAFLEKQGLEVSK